MIWENIKATLNSAAVLKNAREFLVFGFDVPIAPFDFDSGTVYEPGFGGAKAVTVKHSVNYRMSMIGSTKLVFDPSSASSDGTLVMMKPDEYIQTTRDGTIGSEIRYVLPPNSILLRDTGGFLCKARTLPDPPTCPKRFDMGSLRYSLPALADGAEPSGHVADFDAAGFVSCSISARIPVSILASRGFMQGQDVVFRLAFIPCGSGRADIVDLRPSAASAATFVTNTLYFNFATPAPVDCQIVAEYSSPSGWKPLAFTDSTNGFRQSGHIHFEPPADWTATSKWDSSLDIGGGKPGTGRTSRYIRLQRRQSTAAGGGAKLSGVNPFNSPYLICTRQDNPIVLPMTQKNVGHTVSFRFVPISRNGNENLSSALVFNHRIEGKAFA